VDVLCKPNGSSSAPTDGWQLAEKIRAAAGARVGVPRLNPPPPSRPAPKLAPPAFNSESRYFPARKIILLGASTGGTEALKTVLTDLSGDLPGICVVQHIPAQFSKAFADRLNQLCAMEVREAQHGDVLRRGLALVAPGGFHLVLKWNSASYTVDLSQGPQIHHQRPAVDILFDSAVRCGAGPHAVAALLTGMGADGAAGLLRLRQAGAKTIAQDEATCVVFGMPREAIRLGAAQQVVPLPQIAGRLEQLISAVAVPGARANSDVSPRSTPSP